MIKNRILFTIFYALISVFILALSVDNALQKNNQYFDDVFKNLSERIKNVGKFNVYNASKIQYMIDSDQLYAMMKEDQASLIVAYYSDRNEFGFNQGIFPDTSPKGMLIGRGRPDDSIIQNVGHFLFLDREWDAFDQGSIFNKHFLINYPLNYIYLSYRVDNSYDQAFYDDRQISKESLRAGLNDSYIHQVEDKGYFYTRPYYNLFTGQQVISIISPIFSQDEHVLDLGFNIELNKLSQLVELYPTLKNGVKLSIDFKYEDEDYVLSEATNNFFTVAQYKYGINELGYLVASYDITLVARQILPVFLLLTFLYAMIFINHRRIKVEQEEHERVKLQLNLDSMTQLYNRRGLEAILEYELPDYRARQEHIFIIALDANKFKQINDIHGHMLGDKALIFIAEAMTKSTRSTDYCIRMGGDEFLIILPNANKENAENVMDRIHSYLRDFSKLKIGVTISVTQAAVLFKSDEAFDEAYSRVDSLMYIRKGSTDKPESDEPTL